MPTTRLTTAWLIAFAAVLALVGCTRQTRPTALPAGPASVGVALMQATQSTSAREYVKLQYPVVIGAAGARLNPVINRWIGARCPVPQDHPPHYASVSACEAAFSSACHRLMAKFKAAGYPGGCTLDATSEIRLDAAGLLGVVFTTYAFTGGAHGNTVVSYLNLDLRSGRVLKLDDLLKPIDDRKLAAAIETAVRRNRRIPTTNSLKQAGFFIDPLPLTRTVLALPRGLLFTYQSYDVGPYVLGQPHGVVPYSAVQGMIRPDGPLPRLEALGKRLAAVH
ncbi:MAG TPA: DUF4163 domain-containing protein [Nevskiaceae bacterium]|nr:DUF4163 domain-containing protein [Nevskiaceae bacterium]